MIEWMQTHRKWLVITIWIATIAFIGAGFVGWGQFQFGKNASTVAKVGNTEVSVKDWQESYSQIFEEYNKALGGTLDEATAKKLGLQKIALQRAIQTAILREYAKNLDLYVTDEDVAKKILEYFKDKQTYKTYLKNTGQKAVDFEEKLKKQLLIEKLLTFLHIKPSNTELISVGSALYNADRLEINILKRENINVKVNEKEIKEFWSKNKNKYLTPIQYKIAYTVIPLNQQIDDNILKNFYKENKLNYKNEKGEIQAFEKVRHKVKEDYLAHKLKKEAILAYKNLKTSKGDYKIKTVPFSNDLIPEEKMQTLIKNGYLKPFVYKEKYITAKLLEEIKPKPLEFSKAKEMVLQDLINKKSYEKLILTAKNMLSNFKGKDLGFVTKYDANKIKNLPAQAAQEFLFRVFVSQKPKDFVLIPSKNPQYAVLYKIKEQKLLDEKKYEENKKYVYNLTEALINSQLLADLLKELSQKYEIVSYVKDKD
ncbi:MAG: peptidylprolyl isomerase [Nautiliaceae bacterium]